MNTDKYAAARSPWGINILLALREKHVYAGTANPEQVARRRAKNRVARRSRRVNRLRSS